MHFVKVFAVSLVVLLVAQFLWRRFRKSQLAARQQLAILDFPEQLAELEAEFVDAANATGKPRGLRWKECKLSGDPLYAIDRSNAELIAMIGVTVSFEAIEGGGMEDVEAVSNLRSATAVFNHRGGRWTTDGRVVFNLEPPQALERFGNSLEPVSS